MDIRTISDEEKQRYIERLKTLFAKIQRDLKYMEEDWSSSDLEVQATAVWIAGQLCNWYEDFKTQLRTMDQHMQTLDDLKQDIQETNEGEKPNVIVH